MIGDDTFDHLYNRLAHAWEAHETLRRAHPPITALAESSARLYEARVAMWNWHSRHSSRRA